MRETFLPGRCEGCGEVAWLVAVEHLPLGGAWHKVEIWFPHAACGRSGSFDHIVLLDPIPLTAKREPAAPRTTSWRRRA